MRVRISPSEVDRQGNGTESKKDNEWHQRGKGEESRNKEAEGGSATLAIEGKGGVKIRNRDGRDVTINKLSTMKSRRKVPMKSSKARVDA